MFWRLFDHCKLRYPYHNISIFLRTISTRCTPSTMWCQICPDSERRCVFFWFSGMAVWLALNQDHYQPSLHPKHIIMYESSCMSVVSLLHCKCWQQKHKQDSDWHASPNHEPQTSSPTWDHHTIFNCASQWHYIHHIMILLLQVERCICLPSGPLHFHLSWPGAISVSWQIDLPQETPFRDEVSPITINTYKCHHLRNSLS